MKRTHLIAAATVAAMAALCTPAAFAQSTGNANGSNAAAPNGTDNHSGPANKDCSPPTGANNATNCNK
jgi:hypothetical protein